jgi:hypothetical protein
MEERLCKFQEVKSILFVFEKELAGKLLNFLIVAGPGFHPTPSAHRSIFKKFRK